MKTELQRFKNIANMITSTSSDFSTKDEYTGSDLTNLISLANPVQYTKNGNIILEITLSPQWTYHGEESIKKLCDEFEQAIIKQLHHKLNSIQIINELKKDDESN
jgi:hypothetical protein